MHGADAHFWWGSVLYGYLLYDTMYTLLFWRSVGSADFLVHHTVALACCAFGLYCGKLALFGMAIQVRPGTPVTACVPGVQTCICDMMA